MTTGFPREGLKNDAGNPGAETPPGPRPRPLRLVRRGGVIEDLIRREVAAGTRMPAKIGKRP